MPARPKCPDCYVQLRVKERPDSRWRYCEECGWDERGKFEVTVWGDEGDIEKKLWEADADEVAAVEEQYGVGTPLPTVSPTDITRLKPG